MCADASRSVYVVLLHSIVNILYKNVEAQIQDFYYIELRTLLNKVLRLGLEPNVLIKDIECTVYIKQSHHVGLHGLIHGQTHICTTLVQALQVTIDSVF